MRSTAYYIKTVILSFLLFVESVFLTHYMFEYIKTQEYFTLAVETLITIALLLLALAYTQALTVGAWDKWTQLLIIPFPITLGTCIVLFPTAQTQIFIVGGLLALLSIYNILRTTKVLNLFIKLPPQLAFKTLTNGLFTAFSVVAAIIVLLNPTDPENLNIGGKIADLVNTQINSYIEKDQSLASLKNFGLLNLDFKDQIETEVDRFVEPYKKLLTPLTAVFMFLLIRSLGSLVGLIYTVTITPIFWFAKRVHFFTVTKETIEREKLTFESNIILSETPQPS